MTLSKEAFDSMMGSYLENELKKKMGFLYNFSFFKDLPSNVSN